MLVLLDDVVAVQLTDTIYAEAFPDLSNGPVILTMSPYRTADSRPFDLSPIVRLELQRIGSVKPD